MFTLSAQTQLFLDNLGASPEQAHDALFGWVGSIIAVAVPPQYMRIVMQNLHAAGLTTEGLGEVAGWPEAPYPPELVKSFFELNFGVDVSFMDETYEALPPVEVTGVTSPTVDEGEDLVFHVTLSRETDEPTSFPAAITGGLFEFEDIDSFAFSDGVTVGVNGLDVPAGVSTFTITIGTADDTEVEVDETIWLEVHGLMPTGTIVDNDTPPGTGDGLPFMPEELAGLLPMVQLNDETGNLSTSALREAIIAHSNEADYMLLFDASVYAGAGDGTFTNADIGWTLGDQPATDATVESAFFGTVVAALQNVSMGEWYSLQTFVAANRDAIFNGDPVAFDQLMDLLVDAFIDTTDQPQFDGNMIHGMVVEMGVELVAVAQHQPSLFLNAVMGAIDA